MLDWRIFDKDMSPHDRIADLPKAPPWRTPGWRAAPRETFQAGPQEIEMVNAALYLRRPLLVTGRPGTGKSSLARAVAHQLNLGELLVWPINTRSTLVEGLYRYDAVGRLQAASLAQMARRDDGPIETPDIGQFLRLGPLGTAMLPRDYPRVLLIDELDKSDIDLPNDLLHVFERGEFEIPELSRLARQGAVSRVRTADGAEVEIPDGWVRCEEFPLVMMTSNGERDFPPAFMRRCLHLRMELPDRDKLVEIVKAHLGELWEDVAERAGPLIEAFLAAQTKKELATDQLLNLVYMTIHLEGRDGKKPDLADALLKSIQGDGG
jgi:MoxR-like ATPase